MSEENKVTIDGEEYSFEGLTVETQANIARVNERQALLKMYIQAISDSVKAVDDEEDEAVVQ